MNAKTRRWSICGLALMLLAAAAPAQAQGDAANYPNKVIRMIVGFAAGGGNDIFARLVATKLSEVGSSRVDLQACKLEYSIVSPK